MSIEELEREAMKLKPEERVRLGAKLLGSVSSSLDFEDEWVEEVERRIAEIRNGTTRLVPSEKMFRDALDSLK